MFLLVLDSLFTFQQCRDVITSTIRELGQNCCILEAHVDRVSLLVEHCWEVFVYCHDLLSIKWLKV